MDKNSENFDEIFFFLIFLEGLWLSFWSKIWSKYTEYGDFFWRSELFFCLLPFSYNFTPSNLILRKFVNFQKLFFFLKNQWIGFSYAYFCMLSLVTVRNMTILSCKSFLLFHTLTYQQDPKPIMKIILIFLCLMLRAFLVSLAFTLELYT